MNTTHNNDDGKPTHDWKFGSELGIQPHSKLYSLEMCKNCGVLRGDPKYPETPCKGDDPCQPPIRLPNVLTSA